MRKLLCNEDILHSRLKDKNVRWQYWLLFKKLVLFMRSDKGQVPDYILEEIWSFVERRNRYTALSYFEKKGIISISKDDKDKRNRHISILIEYSDTFYEVLEL